MEVRHKLVALVPMRHNSERVPGKNYRPFAGQPLFYHILETLLGCDEVDKVVVDTDSAIIKESTSERFPEVCILDRPEHLRDGAVAMNDVILHDVRQVESNFYLQTHSTNPLLKRETIGRAIQVFFENCPENDSLFTVTPVRTRLWDDRNRAVNHDPSILLRTQDLPPLYEENSCLYIFCREVFVRRRNRIGDRPRVFVMDREEAWDIDEEVDFRVAEFLFESRGQ